MARTRRRAAAPVEVEVDAPETSRLPDNFEVFAESMKTEEPAKAEKPSAPVIGGMVEKKWSGVPMWECPRCRATTFDAAEAKIHTCKTPKFASDLEDEADKSG